MSARALRILIAVLMAGCWGALLGVAHINGSLTALDGIESTLTDMRTRLRGPRVAPARVTIVAIDDETVRVAGGYPLPRATLARLVTTIAALKPGAIVLDILLVDKGPADGDRLLADALRKSRSVIASAAVFSKSLQAADEDGLFGRIPVADHLLMPLPQMAQASTVGVVNVATDRTGTPRFVPLLFRSADRVELALALQAVMVATVHDPTFDTGSVTIGDHAARTDIGQVLPLSFYGPRGTINTVSAAAVLNGALQPSETAGHIYVIGATVTGAGDVFPTPFDPVLPGVEVISTAISHLMSGDGLVRDTRVRRADAGLATVLPMVLVLLLAWRRNTIGLALVALVVVAVVAGNYLAFTHNYWLSLTLAAAAALPPALLFGASEFWADRRHAQHFSAQSALLQRVHAPGMANWLASHPEFLAQPLHQYAAVVFIDLSGFTAISAEIGPGATRELLDAFYHLVDTEVTACGGVINSFMGDGVMIIFGLPTPSPRDAANAVRCAVRLCPHMQDWLASRPGFRPEQVGFKVGAHAGPVIASRIGPRANQQIVITGDTVNVASRLMGVAANHGVALACSAALMTAAGHDAVSEGSLSGPIETEIKGRPGLVPVFLWRAEAG